ncbi:hypothetical protein GCM10023084_22300 [Streptomyces lacrimifluminis]|uniref:DUF7674 domain-containing protein n=1 Tax=Streptomyces lacrimifluminis TaxID=1500077 RepID=A0A917L9W9_9ACTN|nr:hypothetical protein [Streptomyces lacrimifluminis]GGJ53469.1 hypothetical protein GCM10012282_58180 [Streptomyces lacrimifluminis]
MTTSFSTPAWFGDLLGVSDVLAAKDRAGVVYWRGFEDADPDDVPPFTFRLADLATVFADHAAEQTSEQKQRVLGILEEVQASGSEHDSTAVATGFFEALLNAWDEGFDLQAVWEYVGSESREHCLAWNEFTGVPTPDWMR